MAWANGDPVVTSTHIAPLDCHCASSKQATLQVCAKGVSQGNPDIILPLQEFDATCDWLEQHTLIGYFVGRTPPKAMLRDWVNKS